MLATEGECACHRLDALNWAKERGARDGDRGKTENWRRGAGTFSPVIISLTTKTMQLHISSVIAAVDTHFPQFDATQRGHESWWIDTSECFSILTIGLETFLHEHFCCKYQRVRRRYQREREIKTIQHCCIECFRWFYCRFWVLSPRKETKCMIFDNII